MKTILSPARLIALLACITLSTSCYTTYDSYGNPRQSVDPGVAIMGVAAAGIVGYALANDNNDSYNQNNYYGGGGHYHGSSYSHGGGYYDSGYSHCY